MGGWFSFVQDSVDFALVVSTALAGPIVAFAIVWFGRDQAERQLRAAEQQATISLIQSLNTYDFDLHRIFIAHPKLRPYFYSSTSPSTDALEEKDQQRIEAVVGYVLDYFHLIAATHARWPERIPVGYVEWMEGWLATNPRIRAYLDAHRAEWSSWFELLDKHRARGMDRLKHRSEATPPAPAQ